MVDNNNNALFGNGHILTTPFLKIAKELHHKHNMDKNGIKLREKHLFSGEPLIMTTFWKQFLMVDIWRSPL